MNVQAIGLGERVLLVAPMFIGVLAAVALVSLTLWVSGWVRATRSTEGVRHGRLLELAMPPASALGRVAPLFPAVDWLPTSGDGSLNWAHCAPGRPGISIEAVPARDGQCDVHVWMSEWTMRGRQVRYAAVAAAQIARVADSLLQADPDAASDVTSDATCDAACQSVSGGYVGQEQALAMALLQSDAARRAACAVACLADSVDARRL